MWPCHLLLLSRHAQSLWFMPWCAWPTAQLKNDQEFRGVSCYRPMLEHVPKESRRGQRHGSHHCAKFPSLIKGVCGFFGGYFFSNRLAHRNEVFLEPKVWGGQTPEKCALPLLAFLTVFLLIQLGLGGNSTCCVFPPSQQCCTNLLPLDFQQVGRGSESWLESRSGPGDVGWGIPRVLHAPATSPDTSVGILTRPSLLEQSQRIHNNIVSINIMHYEWVFF